MEDIDKIIKNATDEVLKNINQNYGSLIRHGLEELKKDSLLELASELRYIKDEVESEVRRKVNELELNS
jgi:hypothetical protein